MQQYKNEQNTALGSQMMAVAQAWRRALSKVLAQEGLSDATALPLTVLNDNGDGIRQNELADKLGLDGTSLVRILDTLEREGLVRRQEDPRDRRAKLVYLTETGSDMAERSQGIFTQLRKQVLENIAAEDIDATQRLLNGISAALGNLSAGRKS